MPGINLGARNTGNKTEKAPDLSWGACKPAKKPDMEQEITNGMDHEAILTQTAWYLHLVGIATGKIYPNEKKSVLQLVLHHFA